MKNTHIKPLLIASGIAALALGGAIGGTFALFNRSKQVVTHVKVGNLNFEFSRTKLKSKLLNDEGYLEDIEDTTAVDLTEDGSKAFDLENIAPGSEVEAAFKLKNTGGTAFETSLDLLNVEVKENGVVSTSVSWLEQVSVSFVEGENATDFNLKDLKNVNLNDLAKGQESDFTLKLSFDPEIENEAQNQEISFAIRLSCTQLLSKA